MMAKTASAMMNRGDGGNNCLGCGRSYSGRTTAALHASEATRRSNDDTKDDTLDDSDHATGHGQSTKCLCEILLE